MTAGPDPANPAPPPAGRPNTRGPRGLLAWYYSPTGTLIRVGLYILVIGLVLAWKMGWIWQPPPTPRITLASLAGLDEVTWKKLRWQTAVPDNLALGELPFIEVAFREPPAQNRDFSLPELADGLHLFSAEPPHTMLSWPIAAASPAENAAGGPAIDEAIQPHAFNGQWIVAFLVRPEQLVSLPDTLWVVYLDPNTAPAGATPPLKPLAILTAANLQATIPPKALKAPTAPVPPTPPATAPAPAAHP